MSHFSSKKTTFVIIILSTCVFLGLLYKEYSNLNNYMNYISENGRSALFHEEYINQNLAFRLSRAFSADANIKKHDTRACHKLEHLNGVNGFNLASHDFQALPGTLQTTNASCEQWVKDIAYLPLINSLPARKTSKYTFSNYSGYAFDNIRYYIDVANSYIYINKLVDSSQYTFNNWLVIHHNSIDIKKSAQTISIDDSSLKDLAMGENIISHVYRDGYTHHNIISMLTPVFKDSTFKGIIITDINISDLATSFYTADRPVIWKFLSMHIEDNATGKKINFHNPTWRVRTLIHHKEAITQYYSLHISLDIVYFIISNAWLIFSYLLTTYLLCAYANYHLTRNARLSRENITDVMTGLYNRKLLSPSLQAKIDELLEKGIAVSVIALDCDGLKRINDTLGHPAGDRMIQALGKAIDQSIRKSDYGIRLGGDEFNIILIDNTLDAAQQVVKRIENNLAAMDTDFPVNFSWGGYQMQPGESLDSAFAKADGALYLHKKGKRSR
ncbi:diguanylate cyclase [Pseudocitrobacter sp. RIT415]|uniref:diguanylate cyclase DgcJ n=1 Tax=Pseudocitrobacter sp. RIT415 TaxID=2202163 RepID=UPI000D39DEA5|nr:diguanylate cyclase DgcJ [Pseudocitrobacter sp. RIT 415]RAU47151.1 diguanylate cyclase [Pseudocitrobacter sp. RIT 415]